MAQQRQHAHSRRLPGRWSRMRHVSFSRHIQNTSTNVCSPQFSIALFVLIDAASFSKSALNGSVFHFTFVDWIPGIFSALGMIVINSIDKTRLSGDGFSYSGDGVAWKAKVVLFMGFAAMAGGLAGGVCVMVLKYVVNEAAWPAMWMGVANVVANALVMLRYVYLVMLLRVKVRFGVLADDSTVRSSSGSARIWRTTIRTTWPCKGWEDACFCNILLDVHSGHHMSNSSRDFRRITCFLGYTTLSIHDSHGRGKHVNKHMALHRHVLVNTLSCQP